MDRSGWGFHAQGRQAPVWIVVPAIRGLKILFPNILRLLAQAAASIDRTYGSWIAGEGWQPFEDDVDPRLGLPHEAVGGIDPGSREAPFPNWQV